MRTYFLLRLTASIGFLFLMGVVLTFIIAPKPKFETLRTKIRALPTESGPPAPKVDDLII